MGVVPVQRGVTGMGSILGVGCQVLPSAASGSAAGRSIGPESCPSNQRPPAIAFVACTRNRRLFRQDSSFIYRCENLGLALQAAGHLRKRFEAVRVAVLPNAVHRSWRGLCRGGIFRYGPLPGERLNLERGLVLVTGGAGCMGSQRWADGRWQQFASSAGLDAP